MKNDLFKKLADNAEIEYLQQQDLQNLVGGTGADVIVIKNPLSECGGTKNTLSWCPIDSCDIPNACDIVNLGGCVGNTVMGGPGTCPLSE